MTEAALATEMPEKNIVTLRYRGDMSGTYRYLLPPEVYEQWQSIQGKEAGFQSEGDMSLSEAARIGGVFEAHGGVLHDRNAMTEWKGRGPKRHYVETDCNKGINLETRCYRGNRLSIRVLYADAHGQPFMGDTGERIVMKYAVFQAYKNPVGTVVVQAIAWRGQGLAALNGCIVPYGGCRESLFREDGLVYTTGTSEDEATPLAQRARLRAFKDARAMLRDRRDCVDFNTRIHDPSGLALFTYGGVHEINTQVEQTFAIARVPAPQAGQ